MRRTLAIIAAALFALGTAAAVTGMTYDPPPAHHVAMTYDGHGG